MSKTAAMCISVVFICIVAPLIGGFFLMPTEVTDEVKYVADQYTDITSGIENATEDFPTYNSTYINNQYFFTTSVYGVDYTLNGDTTTNKNSFPYLTMAHRVTNTSAWSDGEITIDLNTYTTHSPWNNAQMVEFSPYYIGGSASRILDEDGNEWDAVIWWPATKLAYGVSLDDMTVVGIGDTITITTRFSDPNMTYYISYYQQQSTTGNYSGTMLYYDPSLGFLTTGGTWSNGNVNTTVSMVINATTVTLTAGRVPLYVVNDGNMVYVSTSSASDTSHALGSPTVYDKLNIVWDSTTDTIAVSGLSGMTNYTAWAPNYAQNTVTLTDVGLPDGFSSVGFSYNANGTRYYVPYSMTAGGTSLDVIKDKTVSMKAYFPDQDGWAMGLQSVIYYGDSISFRFDVVNSVDTALTLRVVDGKFKDVPLKIDMDTMEVLESVDIPVANVSIRAIPQGEGAGLYLNDYYVFGREIASGGLEDVEITFNGTWKVPVTVSKVVSEPIHFYEWKAGTFNINEQTYCLFGLFTAMACGIFGGIACRYDERIRGLTVVMTAVICGIGYLLLMMSF